MYIIASNTQTIPYACTSNKHHLPQWYEQRASVVLTTTSLGL